MKQFYFGEDSDPETITLLDKIKQIIHSTSLKIDNSILQKVYNLLNFMRHKDNVFQDFQTALTNILKLSEENAAEIAFNLSELVEPETLKACTTYLNGERLKITDFDAGQQITFAELMSKTNLPEQDKLLHYLINKEFSRIPKMGKCELFFAFLFQGRNKIG